MSVEGTAKTDSLLVGKVIAIPQVDETLEKKGYGADAKVTGDKLRDLEYTLKNFSQPKANTVEYNNKASGLRAIDVQEAIDEIVSRAMDDINALANKYLSLNGGELKGALKVKRFDNGFSTVDKNHSETNDYGTFVADTTKDGKSAKISVSALLNLLTFTDAEGNIRDVHHEGNKPFGEYTGNGSTASRTIDTKGFGKLCMVYSSEHALLVTPKGALKVVLTDGTIKWIASSNLHYVDGKLIMASDNVAFNKADTTYYYQVL